MPSEPDWAAAYAHLVQHLQRLEAADIAAEMAVAASTRVIEEYRPAYPDQFSSAELSEQSETVSRARRPHEAFHAAVEVLRTYLVEVPMLAFRIGETLEHDPAEIIFLPDARADFFGSQHWRAGIILAVVSWCSFHSWALQLSSAFLLGLVHTPELHPGWNARVFSSSH